MDVNQVTEVLKHADVGQAVMEMLAELGWSRCEGGAAIASKSFQTVVGEKMAHAYLSNGDGVNRSLHGQYDSEGRNILSGSSVLIPLDADLKTCVSLAEAFAANVDTEVSNSYGVRMAAPDMKRKQSTFAARQVLAET